VERRTGVLSSAPFGNKDLHTERGQCQVAGAWQGRTGSRAWRLRLRRARLPAGYLAGVTAWSPRPTRRNCGAAPGPGSANERSGRHTAARRSERYRRALPTWMRPG